ncbi:glycoside hydrolase family 13 protein [Pleurotus eryngii]|uniref:alpha-amylase n=1 Tax=Pleurotus eryngii TaxID=5323 RepID=A0A9P6DD00_PLEER|nr:glycoside hydrolase family 13 protein [Pleurotus eryngii]
MPTLKRLAIWTLLATQTVVPAFAASAEQWAKRSIYQIITDRFALPPGADPTKCDAGEHTWCGGTWNSIRQNLDYIQNAGFTAIWISPVNQNYVGPKTPYGDPYHGYWIQDNSQLNARFGTADDLKALSKELHARKMFLMVDVVVNNVMATSTSPDYSKYMFKDKSMYHEYCPIQWGNHDSEQTCWFGDDKVPLPDVDTKNPTVISTYHTWVRELVEEYGIDGLRIDAAKHVNKDFWPGFVEAAGVFCIGEVYGGMEVNTIAQWQGPAALPSVLNYPLYAALKEAFVIPGTRNTSALAEVLLQEQQNFVDTTVLGNFMENHDVPRWHNMSVDPQSMYNAMAFMFMTDGIPIVYAGQEQYFSGNSDPWNREPLWVSGYARTPAYELIARLNLVRNYLIHSTDWVTQPTNVLTVSDNGIGVMKGPVVSVLTNIGSPPRNGSSLAVQSPYESSTALIDVMNCRQFVVGSDGWLDVEYTKGGVATILVPRDLLSGGPICPPSPSSQNVKGGQKQPSNGVRATVIGDWAIGFMALLTGAMMW